MSNDGNTYAIEALKQVLTLASAIIAVTVAFVKDIIGSNLNNAHLPFLVPVSWLLFLITIWTAWVAIAEAAQQIGSAATTSSSTTPIPYAFRQGVAHVLAIVAQYSFFFGLVCLALFGTLNLTTIGRAASGAKPTATPSPDRTSTLYPMVPAKPSPHAGFFVDALGCVGPFAPGEWSSPKQPAKGGPETQCHWIGLEGIASRLRTSQHRSPTFLLFIGSSDKIGLRPAFSRDYGSNEGLARARADWVRTRVLQLMQFRADEMPKTLILTVGPAEHGPALSKKEMEDDRSVAVFAVWIPDIEH